MTKKDLTICEYMFKGLKIKRFEMEHDQDNLLHNQFHNAMSAAMSSLGSEEGHVDRDGSDDPRSLAKALWTYQRRERVQTCTCCNME